MSNYLEKIKEELTMEKVLQMAIKTPGVKIKRDVFLHKELIKFCPEDIVKQAIQNNPAKAGIPKELINKISRTVINYESKKVTAISFVASLPSSAAAPVAFGSASADIVSYFAHVFRVVQELAYLYGFEQFDFQDDSVDSQTMDFLMVFLGVMFGVQGANTALNKLANVAAEHVAKQLARKALTKGTIYPIIKKIATHIGLRMTKQIFADFVASAIPVAGGALSGGLTFFMFKPCCMKLRATLMNYKLCDPDFYRIYVECD